MILLLILFLRTMTPVVLLINLEETVKVDAGHAKVAAIIILTICNIIILSIDVVVLIPQFISK